MNRRGILAIIFIFSLLFAFQVFAADNGTYGSSSSSESGMSGGATEGTGSESAGMSGAAGSAGSVAQMSKSELMGKSIQSSDGKDIGKISDVVTDPATNRVAYAIVSYGGKNYPVPANAMSMSGNMIALNIDKSKFESAPTLAAGQKPGISDTALNNQVHQFYGVSPSFGAGAPGGTGGEGTKGGGTSGESTTGGGVSGGTSPGGGSGSAY